MTTNCETKVYIDEKEISLYSTNIEGGKIDFNKTLEIVSEIKEKTDEFFTNLLKNNPEYLNVPEKKKNDEEEDEN
jgi:hypothetical protein